MRTGLLLGVGLLLAGVASAQIPAVGTEAITWDQAGDTLAQVQAYVYDAQDGTVAPVTLDGVTCSGAASPFVCSVRLPALTTGLHSLTLRASVLVDGQPLSSPRSAPLLIVIVAVPVAPQNLRLTAP
jgi:hypothetical protein